MIGCLCFVDVFCRSELDASWGFLRQKQHVIGGCFFERHLAL